MKEPKEPELKQKLESRLYGWMGFQAIPVLTDACEYLVSCEAQGLNGDHCQSPSSCSTYQKIRKYGPSWRELEV